MGNLRGAVEAADKLASYYGTRDPFRLAKKIGIAIHYCDLGESILGYSTHANRIPMITLNANNTDLQNQAVCGHELCHCTEHTGCDTNFFNRSAPLMVSGIEAEANAFAFELIFGGKEISPINFASILEDYDLPGWMHIFFDDVHLLPPSSDEY